MTTIIETLSNYWIDIAVLIGIVIALKVIGRILVRKDRKGRLNRILLGLIIEAEKYLGSKTGKLKKQQVILWFIERYKFLSIFVDEEILDKMIDNIVDYLNNYLQENLTNLEGMDFKITVNK